MSVKPLQNEKQDLTAAILSSLPLEIAVLDTTGNIVQVNEAWERFARENGGAPARCGVNANYLEVCRLATGNDAELARQALQGLSCVLHGEIDKFSLEYPCHSPSINRWFLMTAATLRTLDGGVVCHTDITERIMADHKLKQTSDFYRALIENASDLVSIVDREGIIRYQSPSVRTVLGYEQEELLGRPCFDLVHPSDAPKVRAILRMLIEDGSMAAPLGCSFRDKQGAWRALEGIARSAIDNPAVGGVVVTWRDVTERRQAETQLRDNQLALRHSHRTLQAIAARLIEAEETERRRISRELHDDLIQRIAIAALDAGSLARQIPQSEPQLIEQQLRELQWRLTQICGQVRTIAYQLHPSILDDLGLVVAIRSYCAEFTRREGIRTRFTHRNVPAGLPPEYASTVYRVTQEALRNVAKHSGAKSAFVSLTGNEREIVLNVRDQGTGFRVDVAKAHGGLGLTSMEERARMLGGNLTIHSRSGKGATVTARIPWERSTDGSSARVARR